MGKTLTIHIKKKHMITNVFYFDDFKRYDIENGEIIVDMEDGRIGIYFASEETDTKYTNTANHYTVTEEMSTIISGSHETEETILTVSSKRNMLVHVKPVKTPDKATV